MVNVRFKIIQFNPTVRLVGKSEIALIKYNLIQETYLWNRPFSYHQSCLAFSSNRLFLSYVGMNFKIAPPPHHHQRDQP